MQFLATQASRVDSPIAADVAALNAACHDNSPASGLLAKSH